MMTDQKTVADKFNNYFVNVAKNLHKEIAHDEICYHE